MATLHESKNYIILCTQSYALKGTAVKYRARERTMRKRPTQQYNIPVPVSHPTAESRRFLFLRLPFSTPWFSALVHHRFKLIPFVDESFRTTKALKVYFSFFEKT